MLVNNVNDDSYSMFSSFLTFLLGIGSVIISSIYFNDSCEHNVSLILLITGIFLIATFLVDRFVFFRIYTAYNSFNYIIFNLLIAGCVVMSVVLSVYVFSISATNHYCPNVLYWYSFVESILLLIFSLFVVLALIQTRGFLYNNRNAAPTRNTIIQNPVRPTVATNPVAPIRI